MQSGSKPAAFALIPHAMSPPVFRFAPSPNGYLHLGHALSAILNFDMARAVNGRFLLRIEDIDAARCRPEHEQAICEDLAWLGLRWEEPVRRQSAHFDDYRATLARLDAMRLIYQSFEIARRDCTVGGSTRRALATRPRRLTPLPLWLRLALGRRAQDASPSEKAVCAAAGHEGRHGSREGARGIAQLPRDGGRPSRRDRRDSCGATDLGDIVLARKETPTSYHLSVVVNDASRA